MPLFGRILLANVVLLLAACVAIFLVLSPRKVSQLPSDEVLVAALVIVTSINVLMVRRVVAPLQDLTALARRIDPSRPGERVPGASLSSEAGELALTFNEMLERLEQEREESTRRVLAAHESERVRVAQELHDEVGQTLTAVVLQLSRVQNRLSGELKGELHEAQEAARASLEDVRRIATELRPEALTDLGLASALATLSDGFGRRTAIAVHRRIQGDLPPLSDEAELVVYRIAQEALTNIARHAGCDVAEVALEGRSDHVTLTVRDYGHGIPPHRRIDGNGVRGMRERAALVGARLTITSARTGGGTEVRLDVPVERSQGTPA
jgi:two-component system, NarL family, sensor histidine kinase UhpB